MIIITINAIAVKDLAATFDVLLIKVLFSFLLLSVLKMHLYFHNLSVINTLIIITQYYIFKIVIVNKNFSANIEIFYAIFHYAKEFNL